MNPQLPLNEPQERRLAVVLARLESALRHLHADVLHPPDSSRLTHYENPIDPVLAKPIAQAVTDAQAQVEQMARELDLPTSRNSILRAHLAALELLTIDLYASRANGLRGYGKIAPSTADYLETKLAQLEAIVDGIIRQLKTSDPDPQSRD